MKSKVNALRSAQYAADWAEALNFAGPRVRTSPLAWIVLAGGLLGLMALTDRADELHAKQQEAQAQLKRLQNAERQIRIDRAIALGTASGASASTQLGGPGATGQHIGPPLPAPPPLDKVSANQALTMLRLLAFPWEGLLARLDAGAEHRGVSLLGMSLDLTRQRSADEGLQLLAHGVVPDDATALTWAGELPSGRLVSRDMLTSPIASERHTYRLRVQAEALVYPPGKASE